MLRDTIVSQKISLSLCYFSIFVFFGVFVTGITVYNDNDVLSFALYDAMESTYQIKLDESYQPQVIPIYDQIKPSFFKTSFNPIDSNGTNNGVNTFADHPQFRQDISGKYTNPTYDITEFEIPPGWFATESMNGDNGIILTMLPGTTEEFFTKLNSLSNNETLPIMNLVVQDKKDLKERQLSSSMSGTGPSSFSTTCTELTSNSTSTVNGKQFQISTMKCSTADEAPISDGIDFGNNEITKAYKYESPTKMYVLQLILSSDYSSNKMVNETYLSKFQPVLDNAIQTLKIG